MDWWQVVLIFGGIPVVMSVAIALIVDKFSESRVPDGIAAARLHVRDQSARDQGATGEGGPSNCRHSGRE